MNARSFKVIFSKRLGALVAVGENATSQGKSASGEGARGAALAAAVFLSGLSSAYALDPSALPSGHQVAAGQVQVTTSGARMDIGQLNNQAIVNWQSFNVGSGAAVHIQQPSATSVLLNRVVGNDMSQIRGQINANGQVVLVNPNGIVMGPTGRITASAFTASTFGISDANFLAGKLAFERNGSDASVVNEGSIQTTGEAGGYIALIGASVSNQGTIASQGAGVALASGERATVSVPLSGKVRLELDPAAFGSANVANSGVIQTSGGQVLLRAAAVVDAISQVADARVSHTGSIDTSGAQGGRVDVLADHGTVRVSGTVTTNSISGAAGGDVFIGRDEQTNTLAAVGDASGAQIESKGGFVETSGHALRFVDTTVVAQNWLLDPANITIDNTNVGSIQTSLNAGTGVTMQTTGSAGDGLGDGNITVATDISKTAGTDATLTLKAHNDIVINSDVNITSTTGKLNVVLNSDLDGNGAGAIVMSSGSSIESKGGNITLGGGSAGDGSGYARGYNISNRYTGVALNSATLSADGGNISIKGQGNTSSVNVENMRGVNLTGATRLSTSGSGNITLLGIGGNGVSANSNVGIGLTGTSTITGSALGTVSLTGTALSTANGYYHYGVWLSGLGNVITSPGNIEITGVAGGSGVYGFNSGVMVQNSGVIRTTGTGNLSVTGTGASNSGVNNHGVEVRSGGLLASASGTLTVNGTGGLQGDSSFGVNVETTGKITSTGGDIHITATSRTSGQYGYGLMVNDANSTISAGGSGNITVNATSSATGSSDAVGAQIRAIGAVTTANGDIHFTGTSRGTSGEYNMGMAFLGGSMVAGGAGSITLIGNGGNGGENAFGVRNAVVSTAGGDINITGTTNSTTSTTFGISNNANTINSAGGDITFETNSYSGTGTETIQAGAGTVTFQTATTGTNVDLGGSDVHGATGTRTLGLSDAELDRITGAVAIGRAGVNASGSLTISQNISSTQNVTLRSGEDIVIAAGKSITTTGQHVLLNSDSDGNGSGAIVLNSGSSINTSGGNITLGGGLAGDGSGAAVGSSANKDGISLNNASLNAAGGNITLTGQSSAADTGSAVAGAAGILMSNSSTIATTGSGNISLSGTGAGSGTSLQSVGVRITGASSNALVRITGSASGSVNIVGAGTNAATGNNEHGVMLQNATITSNGGNVSITGTGGNSGSAGHSNKGIAFDGATEVSATGSGTVTITGTGGLSTGGSGATANNVGVALNNNNQIFSESGAINITASAPDNRSYAAALADTVASNDNADITITTDSLALGGTISTGTGTVTVQNQSANTLITVGGSSPDVRTSNPKTLVVSSDELSKINAAHTIIGRRDATGSGNVTVSTVNMDGLGRTGSELSVRSGSDITVSGAASKAGATDANLNLDANNRVIISARIGQAAADTTSTGHLNVDITARGQAQTAAQGSVVFNNVIDAGNGLVNVNATSLTGWEGLIFQGTSGITAGTYNVTASSLSTAIRFNGGTSTFLSTVGDSLIEGNGNGYGGVFASSGNTINLNTSGTGTSTLASGASSSNGMRFGFGGGVTINTNGNVTIGSHHTNASLFLQSTVNVNSGHLTIKGRSNANGIGIQDGSGYASNIYVNNGSSLTMNGVANSSGNGIDMRPAGVVNTISMTGTNAGQRGTINLIGSSNTGSGIYTNGSNILSDGGDINLSGTSAGTGISHDGLIRSGDNNTGGVVTLIGTSTGSSTPRLGINSATSIQGGDVVMTGTSAGAQGVYSAGSVTAVSGDITLTGTSAQGAGVHTQGVLLASGDISLVGTSTSTGTKGVIIQNLVESTGGDITVTGTTSASGQQAVALTTTGALYGALKTSAGNDIEVNANSLFINTGSTLNAGSTGTVNLKTTSVGAHMVLGGDDVLTGTHQLGVTHDELARITAGEVIIGDSTHTGNITVSSAVSTASSTGALHLKTSGNIAVNQALSVGGGQRLTLNASGVSSTVTQSAAIQASQLELLGSTVDHALSHASNAFNTVSGSAKSITLNSSTALSIGSVGNTTGLSTQGVIALTSAQSIGGNANINSNGFAASFNTGSGTGTYSGVISGAGNFTKSGAGTTILSSNQSYGGTTTVGGGVLQIGNGGTTGTLGTGNVTLSNGATLAFHRSDATTVSHTVSGTGNVHANISAGGFTADHLSINGNVSAVAAGDIGITNTGALSLSAQTTAANGDISVDNTGALVIDTVNGLSGVSAHGTGDIALSGESTNATGMHVLQNISTLGNVTLSATTSTTTNNLAGLRSSATVSGADISVNASATGSSGHVLGYYGAEGRFIASGDLDITATSTSGSGNGLYTFGGTFQSGTGMSLVGSSTHGQAVGFDNGVTITNGSTGGIRIEGTASTAGQQGIGLNGVTITNGGGALELVADAGHITSTTSFGGSNRLTQSGTGQVLLSTVGDGNLTVPIIVNQGSGNVVVAAGSNLAAGTGTGGQVLTVDDNGITQNSTGKTYVYTGQASGTGQLSDLSSDFAQLYYQGSGQPINTQFNTAYSNTIAGGADTQVLFRSASAPTFTLSLNNISKTYGDADPANQTALNAALQSAYSGPATLTTSVTGANSASHTFAVLAEDVIDGLTGMGRAAGNNVGTYAYTNVSASAFNTTLNAQPNLVITPRDITLSSVTANSKPYDGTTVATIGAATFGNLVAGETLSLSGEGYFNSANVNGVSTVTVDDVTELNQVDGTGLWSNYNLTTTGAITSSATGKITPVALTATVNDSSIFVTQTGTSAPDMGVSYSGFVGGDSASTALSGTAVMQYTGASANPSAGVHNNVLGLSSTPTALNGNYTISVDAGDLTVVAADKLLITIDSQTITYGEQSVAAHGGATDGTVSAVYCLDSSDCSGANLYNLNTTRLSDTQWKAADNTGSFVVFDTNITGAAFSSADQLQVGNYQYTATEIDPLSLYTNGVANFDGRYTNGGVLTVAPLSVTATVSASDKTFDGNTSATATSSISGLSGDDLGIDHVSATFDTAAVGTNITVTVSGLSLSGADAANYRLSASSATTTADIGSAPLIEPTPKPQPPVIKPVVPVLPPTPTPAPNSPVTADSPGSSDNPFSLSVEPDECRVDNLAACVCDPNPTDETLAICYRPKRAAQQTKQRTPNT